MRKYSPLFLTLALIAFVKNSHSADFDQEQNQIIQRQQQFEQDQLRQKEIQEIKKEQEIIGVKEIEKEEVSAAGKCYTISKIELLDGDTIIHKIEKNLKNKYLGSCLKFTQIKEVIKEITAYLNADGYVTARVAVFKSELEKGILKIKITHSYFEGLRFNEDKFFDKTQKFLAFGSEKKGEALNIKKSERRLVNVNRLKSNNAIIKIIPGKDDEKSIILIENHPKNRARFNISADNYGSERTGKMRETIAFEQDNLLWLNDNITFTKTSNFLDRRRDTKKTDFDSLSFSLPLIDYVVNFNISQSSYQFFSGEPSLKISGHTLSRLLSVDRNWIKNKNLKFTSSFAISNRYNQNFQANIKQDTNSRKASFANLAFPTTFFLKDSYLFLKPSYKKSLNIFDAKKDNPNISPDKAHAEFEAFRLYGSYFKKLTLAKKDFSYNLTFDSQIANKTLYGVDNFNIGGIYSVRGFSEGSISQGSGYNLKNELNFKIGNKFSLSPFYDYGYVRKKRGLHEGRLSGAGFNVGFNHDDFDVSLGFSWVLSKSQLLLDDRRENSAVYFNLSYGFGMF